MNGRMHPLAICGDWGLAVVGHVLERLCYRKCLIVNETEKIMTEKEKARAGLLYDANYDRELLAERAVCQQRCHELNCAPPSDVEGRMSTLRRLLGTMGEGVVIVPPFYCDYGYNIVLGKYSFLNMNCVVLDEAAVSFGNHVFVGPYCGFYTAGHPLDVERRNAGLEYARPIEVGDNVWIGGHVCVLPGVCIGEGSVIGAGSVVNRDIPSGVLAAGNPCKVIRPLQPEECRGRNGCHRT